MLRLTFRAEFDPTFNSTLFQRISKDDGDTWVDETGDFTAMSGGIAQWYENTLYVSSMGQGISSKTFAE